MRRSLIDPEKSSLFEKPLKPRRNDDDGDEEEARAKL